MPVKRILVCCAAGYTNIGDDAILEATLSTLRERFPKAQLTVVCGRKLGFNLNGARHVFLESVTEVEHAVLDSDVVIVGGGGLLYDVGDPPRLVEIMAKRPKWLVFAYRIALLCHCYSIPMFVCGVGIGPLETDVGKRLSRLIIDFASGITVRDSASLTTAAALTGGDAATLSYCPALNYDNRWDMFRKPHEVDSAICISLRPSDAKLTCALAEALAAVHAVRPIRLRLLVHQKIVDADEKAMRQLTKAIGGMVPTEMVRPYSPAQSRDMIAECDLVLTTRLHPAILATCVGTPFSALCDPDKLRAFAADINWGYSLHPGVKEAQQVADSIQQMLDQSQEMSYELIQKASARVKTLSDPLSLIPFHIDAPVDSEERRILLKAAYESARDSRPLRRLYCLLAPLALRKVLHGIAGRRDY